MRKIFAVSLPLKSFDRVMITTILQHAGLCLPNSYQLTENIVFLQLHIKEGHFGPVSVETVLPKMLLAMPL